ncbi:hypothetical protein SNOG_09587 [Parastagonospora nodorum SN15]|uniref:Xylanolytic transcriptional activator regulatory domain-containing protein n=1 Tax=Phaeosphaeria nodorum (strain SN15 / ATCC MYA-4574 / FGSC 10173) TaxID=321614 RepID=Q0UF77_PHANO|nr:hypothetical protein SNOG_09587 [Parastagonospora nodorum SN15]EAT82852.1 hypothetical protein SNOG_09587 [Parastagonospora nodorum SN15]
MLAAVQARTSAAAATTPAPRAAVIAPKSVSRIVVAANGSSSYHGRTSTLFDEGPHDRPTAEVRPQMPDEWVERGLVAEAARQRQLETVNFRLGKLDFDGVDPELGMHLLSLHWNRQHHSFLATYRPAFMRDMACGGPYFSKLLLNAIYFGASKFSPRHEVRRVADDVRTAGWQFRQRVRELLGGSLDKSEVTTIQALLVMTNSLFALGDERSAAWLYAGLAFRMIVDLGMHVDTVDLAENEEDSQMREYEIKETRVLGCFRHTIMIIDKIQSLYQGRPVTIKEADTLVPIKFQDTYEELEHWAPFAYSTQSNAAYLGSPAYSISTFRHLCKLSVVLSDILSTIYTERSFDSSPGELSSKLESIHLKLTTWRSELPEHLAVDVKKMPITPPPHVLSLHAMYNVLMILLHRPFVADGHLYSTSRAISVSSLLSCQTAADDIVALLRVYDKAFSVRRAPYLISYSTCKARNRLFCLYQSRDLLGCISREPRDKLGCATRRMVVVQNLMKRLGVASPSLDEIQIESSHNSTPDSSSGRQTGREPSLHSLDIDGIIQSFVREQENSHPAQVGPAGRLNSSDAAAPMQSLWPYPPTDMSNVALAGHNDADTSPYDNNNNWGYSGQQPMFAQDPVNVDDLLYGFNGSALDSFPVLDWDTM